MVTTLQIKNVGIIEDITIDFNEGFNVLTGETGAGKTLIIGALNILAGGRFSKDMIRNGENFSFVEACFFNQKSNDNIIISREIHSNGRNSCKINGRLVTVNELREFMRNIINIHGQQDNQTILNVEEHIKYLDKFIGKNISKELEIYQEKLEKYNLLKKELKNTFGEEREKERRLDLLKYQYNEIENANLKEDEEIELEEKSKIAKNAQKIKENVSLIYMELNENAINSISNAIKHLEKLQNYGDEYSEKLNTLKSSYYDIQEITRDFEYINSDLDIDEKEAKKIEERLDQIYFLKRKYGNTINEILQFKDEVEKEINRIENLEQYHEKIKQEIIKLENEMNDICDKMNSIRKKYGSILSEKINQGLKELEMPNAKISINIEKSDSFENMGTDKVEFYISTNLGEEMKPLVKIASGGEMSRIMLIIKHVLAQVDDVDTLVFDEIDTGISGKASNIVGRKMKEIGKNHQVICITHLPSIAAKGDYNYYISKNTKSNRTYTEIKQLNEDEIIEEIARISSGEVTEIAKAHARELRKVS